MNVLFPNNSGKYNSGKLDDTECGIICVFCSQSCDPWQYSLHMLSVLCPCSVFNAATLIIDSTIWILSVQISRKVSTNYFYANLHKKRAEPKGRWSKCLINDNECDFLYKKFCDFDCVM